MGQSDIFFDLGSERLQLPQLILQKWCHGRQAWPEEFEIGCDVIEVWDCIFDTQAMLTVDLTSLAPRTQTETNYIRYTTVSSHSAFHQLRSCLLQVPGGTKWLRHICKLSRAWGARKFHKFHKFNRVPNVSITSNHPISEHIRAISQGELDHCAMCDCCMARTG